MRRARRIVLGMAAALASLVLAPGCVFVGPRSICRTWANWNTYGQCAFCVDRLDHLPLRQPRVDSMRWAYGIGPEPSAVSPSSCNTPIVAEATPPTVPDAFPPPPPGSFRPNAPLPVPPPTAPKQDADPPVPPDPPSGSAAQRRKTIATTNHSRSAEVRPSAGSPSAATDRSSDDTALGVHRETVTTDSRTEGAWLFRRR